MKKYTKFVATAATATLVASAIVPAAFAAGFNDVKENNSHAEAINALVEAGIIRGYEDGSFRPNAELTRGHVVKMLGKWVEQQGFEIPADWNTVQRFDDIQVDAKDQELVKYAALVKDTGVFVGSNGKLNAGDNISRENMALTLDRAYKAVTGSSLVELAEGAEELVVADLASAKAESREEIQALRNLGISNVENFEPKSSVTRAQFASFLSRTIEAVTYKEVEEELAVASVSTVDSSKIVVEFTQPIDDAQSNLENVKVSKVGEALDAGELAYELSEDGKTLTISTDIKNNLFFDGDYKVVIDFETVKGAEANEFVPVYNTTVNFDDTQAPTFTTEQVSALVYKVKFSEPVKADVVDKITFKDADGNDVLVGKELNEDQTVLTLTIGQEVAVEKEFTATIIGAMDIAGNLLDPNPATFTMVKGDKDGVAPTVETITQTGAKTFTVKLSEEVLENPTVALGTTTDTLEVVNVKVDEKDPTLYHVTAKSVLNTAAYYVQVSNFTDLSGETGETATKLVQFTKDEVAPKATNVELVKDADTHIEYLEVTFDKNVELTSAKATATGTAVKNGVTNEVATVGEGAAVEYIDADDKNVVRVAVKDLFGTEEQIEGAAYNVELTFTGVTSESEVAVAEKATAEFTRGNDIATPVEQPIKVVSVYGVDNNTVVVEFDKEVDPTTAKEISNYSIQDAVITDAVIKAGELNKVYLTLEADSNTFTGVRNATISGVKAKDSELVMETVTVVTGELVENVTPTVQSATLDVATKTIEITFSEAIELNSEVVEDFEIYADGQAFEAPIKFNANVASAEQTSAKTISVLVDNLTAEDMVKSLTLVGLEGSDITDVSGNAIKFEAPITITSNN